MDVASIDKRSARVGPETVVAFQSLLLRVLSLKPAWHKPVLRADWDPAPALVIVLATSAGPDPDLAAAGLNRTTG